MPENTPQNPNSGKKARLGRGLGSLLGGSMTMPSADLEPMTTRPTHDQKSATIQTNQAPPATNPGRATVQSTSPVPTSQEHRASSPAPMRADIAIDPKVANATSSGRPINEESQIWMIGIDKLKPNGQQPRQVFTSEGIRDLTASVKEKGILQPIVARRLNEREFEIIAGERRWRAAQAAGLHQVPVILKKVSEQDSLELAIIENIQRENLNPIDEAEAYQHLVSDYSLTQQQVADKMGKDRSSVANSLRLLSLPGEVRIMLKGNELSTGHAKVLLGLEDKDAQLKIAKQIIEEKLSVRATEKLVAKTKTDQRAEKAPAGKLSPMNIDISQRLVEGLGLELQKLIGTKVGIDYADSKGKIAIHFYSDDQFNQVVEKLRRAWEK